MPHLHNGGFQGASHGSERRADFDLLRRLNDAEHQVEHLLEDLATLQAQTDALPRGIVQILTPVSSTNITPAAATLTNLTVGTSVTFTTGRKFRLVAHLRAVQAQATANSVDISLYNGATSLQPTYGGNDHHTIGVSVGHGGCHAEWIIDGTGTNHPDFIVKISSIVSTTIHLNANTRFYIEDIGAL